MNIVKNRGRDNHCNDINNDNNNNGRDNGKCDDDGNDDVIIIISYLELQFLIQSYIPLKSVLNTYIALLLIQGYRKIIPRGRGGMFLSRIIIYIYIICIYV